MAAVTVSPHAIRYTLITASHNSARNAMWHATSIPALILHILQLETTIDDVTN